MISAIILAAGQSQRMGQPKLLLPWGNTTVLGQVIHTLQEAEIPEILVVTGGDYEAIAELAVQMNVHVVHNANYRGSELLASIQCGLRTQKTKSDAALICLGDQPQILKTTIHLICQCYLRTHSPLVIPSYRMHRGHPWLVARPLWESILKMEADRTPRDFLNAHQEQIEYVVSASSSVIEDLDTPEDYLKYRP